MGLESLFNKKSLNRRVVSLEGRADLIYHDRTRFGERTKLKEYVI